MIPLFLRTQISALLVMLIVSAAMTGLGLVVVPSVMWFSTYVTVTGLAVAIAAVTLNAARNARPIPSLGQLLYETDNPMLVHGAAARRPGASRNQ